VSGLVYAQKSFWAPNGEKTFTGTAIDFTTGKSLPGIWVMASYYLRPGGIHEQARCTVLEVVRSDSMGHYELPFYDGLPPEFIQGFGTRYQLANFGRDVSKNNRLRWIVRVIKPAVDRNEVVATEGPFATERDAQKAARIFQDVWLKPFTGTDDAWLQQLAKMAKWEAPCKSRQTRGGVQWREALISEAESMPESPKKTETLQSLRRSLDAVRELDPGAAGREGQK
jgi:hypothetical protein